MEKINLAIFNKLVSELKSNLEAAEAMGEDIPVEEKVAAYDKVIGLAYGVSMEASGLISDALKCVRMLSTPKDTQEETHSLLGFDLPGLKTKKQNN